MCCQTRFAVMQCSLDCPAICPHWSTVEDRVEDIAFEFGLNFTRQRFGVGQALALGRLGPQLRALTVRLVMTVTTARLVMTDGPGTKAPFTCAFGALNWCLTLSCLLNRIATHNGRTGDRQCACLRPVIGVSGGVRVCSIVHA